MAQAILVAGYCTRPNESEEPILEDHYDWTAIKANVQELLFINSRTDPCGCVEHQGRAMFEQLGGTQIVRDDGHLGDYNPGVRPISAYQPARGSVAARRTAGMAVD